MISAIPMIAAASILAPGVHAGLRTTGMGALETSKVDRRLSNSCSPPSDVDRFAGVLAVSKLQCPDSGTEYRELSGFCNDQFYVSGEYMNFETDDERCELRTPFDPVNNVNVNFRVSDAQAKIESTVSLPNKQIGDGNYYTWMQIHGDDTSYVRLTHYGLKEGLEDYLWLYLKTGSSSSYEFESIQMVPMPAGDFQASLTLNAGRLTVAVDGWSQTYDTDGGNPTDYPVLYKNLLYDGPGSDDATVTSTSFAETNSVIVEEDDAPLPAVSEVEDAPAPAPEEGDEDGEETPAPAPEEGDEDDEEAPAPASDGGDDGDMNNRTQPADGDVSPVSAPEPASDEPSGMAEEEEVEEAPAPSPAEESSPDMKKKKSKKNRCDSKDKRRRSMA